MENKPIENHKEICRKLAPEGWHYGGFEDGVYFFQSGNYKDGFYEIELHECDLTSENIKYMTENKLTRTNRP